MRTHGFSKVGFGLTVTVLTCGALFTGTAVAWSPEPAQYGIVEQQNLTRAPRTRGT